MSRLYLADSLPEVTKAKLVPHANGAWLTNTINNTNYNTYLIAPPHPQTGMVRLLMSKAGDPLCGRGVALASEGTLSWLVLHDPTQNKVYLIPWANFVAAINALCQNPQAYNGMMNVSTEGDYIQVMIHLDWAVGSRIIRHVAGLKGSYLQYREKKLVQKEVYCHLHGHSEMSLLDGACAIEGLAQMLTDEGVPLVTTNDFHYEREEDAIIQAILTRISNQKVDGLGEKMSEKGVYYIRSREEVAAGAPWITADMMDRTVEVMERCTLSFKREGYLFPPFDVKSDPDWAAFQETKK